jgi:hypothetical protein
MIWELQNSPRHLGIHVVGVNHPGPGTNTELEGVPTQREEAE